MTDHDLFEFITGAVRSVWAVELLLLLRRQPDRRWRADELVRELRASTTVVTEAVAGFEAAGLVRQEDGCILYEPASPWLAERSDRLEQLYRKRPVAVVNAIVSPGRRLQGFADAFRLKDKDGEG